MDFRDLLGKEFLFYGVDNHTFKLDDNVWEAVEDECDGYRSMCSDVHLHAHSGGIFFREPISIVRLVEEDNHSENHYGTPTEGYKLVDVDYNHTWLSFGTENYDDYYPCFYFNYTPRQPSLPKNKSIRGKSLLSDPFDSFFEPRES